MDTFFPTSTPDVYASADSMAEETLREQIANLGMQITSLQSQLQSTTSGLDFQRGLAQRMSTQIRDFQDALKEHLAYEDISPEMAKGFADIFGFDLTREVFVNFTVQITGTASVPIGVDLDTIEWENECDIDIRSYSDYDLDVYVDTFDAECEEK